MGSSSQQPQSIGTLLRSDLDVAMTKALESIDVSDAYSPPRVTRFAEERNLGAGLDLDLTAVSDECERCDFSRERMNEKAIRLLDRDRPTVAYSSILRAQISSRPCISIGADGAQKR